MSLCYLSHSDFFNQVFHKYCTFVKNVSHIFEHMLIDLIMSGLCFYFIYFFFLQYLKLQSVFAKVWVNSKASALQLNKGNRSWKDGA